MRASGWLAIVAAVGAMSGGCSGSKGNGKPSDPPKQSHDFKLFITTELRGTIEPCGCTADPLGDLARMAALLAAARAQGPVLFVDSGSMLFSEPTAAERKRAQETLKADLLVNTFAGDLQAGAIGLGPYDLAAGPAAVRPARQAANIDASSGIAIEPPKVIDVGGVEVGIFGVVSPLALADKGIAVSDPIAAAELAVADLRRRGARIVVALAHMTHREAVELAGKADGIDIVVVGQNAPEPDLVKATAQQVGSTWLVNGANRGQVVTRLDITITTDNGPLHDAGGTAAAAAKVADLDEQIANLRADLAKWEADPTSDADFVARKKLSLDEILARRDSLAANPLQVPDTESWFVMEQIEISKALPCSPTVQAAKVEFDKASGAANVKAMADVAPEPPQAGQAGFVGQEECSYCHPEAIAFWQKTKHFEAWETLEAVGKQFNFDCIYCHVTGFDEPGGSTLAVNEYLRDVQCETCHGPGSLHVDADGKEKPTTLILAPAETRCMDCHSPEHSDTFDYTAYLRDVTGVDHGEAFRAKLGDGPTGHDLRAAALAKAGALIGAGCPK